MFELELETGIEGVVILIDVTHYSPERPAPPCSNPSSPAYSDPGDDEEIEYELYFLLPSGIRVKIESDYYVKGFGELDSIVMNHIRKNIPEPDYYY